MKTQIKKNNFGKVAYMALGAMVSLSLMFAACSKNDELSADAAITEDDVYDVIEGTLVASTYGLSETVGAASMKAEETAAYTATPAITCGTPYTRSFTRSASGTSYGYNYAVQENYQLKCTEAGEASTFLFTDDIHGSYDAVRMSSDDSSESELSITGLEPSNTVATLNGFYERKGTQESKVHYERNFTSTVTYDLNDLEINKSSHKIEGGTATLNVSLTADGTTKTYYADLTFNGDYTATLDINGIIYTINIY
ncbi:MAG: hypothetical protein QHC79_18845 [Pseudosphingobacterium sp.]|nr:hypothetical protein [Pseudosphingobacterium sp.]